MADLEFNLDDVNNLAQKLSNTQQDLTKQDHALLLAIFAAAAARAKVTNEATGTSTLPQAKVFSQAAGADDGYATAEDLQQQLLNAYIPGNYFDDVTTRTDKTVGLRTESARLGKPPDQ